MQWMTQTVPQRVVDSIKQAREAAHRMVRSWEELSEALVVILGPSGVERLDVARVKGSGGRVREAFEVLTKRFSQPPITLATAGTTNSGKSALVNFLCGHKIVPVAVTEMSAGVVRIRRDPARRIKVLLTGRACWECGEWTDPADVSDEAIHDRIKRVMMAYHARRGQPDEPEPPSIEVDFPTWMEFPGFDLSFMDLPGLKFVGDEQSARVIAYSKKALCLVTYNSEETDEHKQHQLLQQVVEQVKELGGSPARMMFVLNRIDALRRDAKDLQTEERLFAERTAAGIRGLLRERLPEYSAEIERVQVVRLSTLPALLALEVLGWANERADAVRAAGQLEENFNALIPRALLKKLPRDIEDWGEEHFKELGEAVWETSRGREFIEQLDRHIEDHIPELIVPPVVGEFREEVAEVLGEAQQIISSEVNRTTERFDAEKARIERVSKELGALWTEAEQQLLQPLVGLRRALDSRAPLTEEIQKVFRDEVPRAIKYPLVAGPESLAPLYLWRDEIGRAINATFESVARAIYAGHGHVEGPVESVGPEERRQLLEACARLVKVDYKGDSARKGFHVVVSDAHQKASLRFANNYLNDLARALAAVTTSVVRRVLGRESVRIHTALQGLFESHMGYVSRRARAVAPDILGPARLPKGVTRTNVIPQFNFRFQAGFPISTNRATVLAGTQLEVVDERRRWQTLFLRKEPVYAEKPVYRELETDSANIPGLDALLSGLVDQARSQMPALEDAYARAIIKQVESTLASVRGQQGELLNAYRRRLQEAHERAADAQMHGLHEWDRVRALLEGASRDLESLTVVVRAVGA